MSTAANKKSTPVKQNRRERRNWDQYVTEAREVFSEIELPSGEVLTIFIPTADAIENMTAAEGDLWGQLAAVLGDENCEKFRAVAQDVPVTALSNILMDVLEDLGLSGDSENSSAA